MGKKLIIWDFDGVIADTEKLWIQTRMELLNQIYGVNWDYDTTHKYLGGMSDKTKEEVLKSIGIITDSDFWQKAMDLDLQEISKGLVLSEGIEDIFKLNEFVQCIATGGVSDKTDKKIEACGIRKYFSAENVFCSDMVEYGKPEPDVFLLAQETMGFSKEQSIIVEDSVAGVTAAQKAKIDVIAYCGSKHYNEEKEIKKMGVEVFYSMNDIKKYLLSIK